MGNIINLIKKNRAKITAVLITAVILAGAFVFGGRTPKDDAHKSNIVDSALKTEQTADVSDIENTENKPENESQDISENQVLEQAEQNTGDAPKNTSLSDTAVSQDKTERPGGSEHSDNMSADEKTSLAQQYTKNDEESNENGNYEYSLSQGMTIDLQTNKDEYNTDPVPEGKPIPVEPQNIKTASQQYTCTLSVSCSTILDNISWLNKEKRELVPSDGWIMMPEQVTFYEGESVFNVLQRTMKQKKIHMEFTNTPVYNSAYIEGINNIYEFDCGELSGWMYKVNNWFPNYGCSRYQLHDGDVIEWVYTCNLGDDVGGAYSAQHADE